MIYLFSREGLYSLEPFLGSDTLLAFDFDGTLAPIVKDPSKAILSPASAALLRRLSRKAPVALVSGRSARDLRSRSRFPLTAWIGNHGMEGIPGREEKARAASRLVKSWENGLREPVAAMPGVLMENKKYSLTLHYRAAPNRAARRRQLVGLAASLRPEPRILPGKCVLNLLVPGHPHKGDALRALMARQGFDKAIFVGDDDTDEDVFRLRDPRIFSVRVGLRKGSPAQTFLKSQNEVEDLLRLLLATRT